MTDGVDDAPGSAERRGFSRVVIGGIVVLVVVCAVAVAVVLSDGGAQSAGHVASEAPARVEDTMPVATSSLPAQPAATEPATTEPPPAPTSPPVEEPVGATDPPKPTPAPAPIEVKPVMPFGVVGGSCRMVGDVWRTADGARLVCGTLGGGPPTASGPIWLAG